MKGSLLAWLNENLGALLLSIAILVVLAAPIVLYFYPPDASSSSNSNDPEGELAQHRKDIMLTLDGSVLKCTCVGPSTKHGR